MSVFIVFYWSHGIRLTNISVGMQTLFMAISCVDFNYLINIVSLQQQHSTNEAIRDTDF